MNATFKRNFTIIGKRQIGFDGSDKSIDVISFKCCRRAAAEIDRMNGGRLLCGSICPKLQFLD